MIKIKWKPDRKLQWLPSKDRDTLPAFESLLVIIVIGFIWFLGYILLN
jgi:hypothetical protein